MSLIFLTSLSLAGLAQNNPGEWNIISDKTGKNIYTLRVTAAVAKGWYIYAEDDTVNGLNAITISWDNENIVKTAERQKQTAPALVQDSIFGKKLKVYAGRLELSQTIMVKGTAPAAFTITIHGFACGAGEFLPIEVIKEVRLEGGVEAVGRNEIKLSSVDLQHPSADCGNQEENSKSLLAIFFLGFAGGLIALLTPCVFPMIPVTVSFFSGPSKSKQAGIKNGILYGTFIFLIYLAASIPFHLLNNIKPEIFNAISTNAWVNIFFFVVFIFFALSFFGFFEISAPSFLTNKAAERSGLGSVGGIFWQLTSGMGGFGAALALPFALFAMFPHWMKQLPKSGGWMNTLKKVLAFAELALAFKFLSNADLVSHWGILKREVFIGIWVLIAFCLALYLFGLLPLPHERNVERVSSKRHFAGMLALFFAGYLSLGLTNTSYANLSFLSGFPPPMNYSLYARQNATDKAVEPVVVNDYRLAVQLAKVAHKPLLIDFTGWACVNCRKMEENVWSEPEVADFINNHFILVSLYVDDKEKLSPEERFIYQDGKGGEKDIMTKGDKWATFQAENFGQVTQPLYVVLSSDEKLLNHPAGYTPDAKTYKSWLECGWEAYQKE